jgi:ribosomal protein S1
MLLMGAAVLPAQKAAREPKDAIIMTGSVSKIAGDTMTVSVSDQSADVKLLPTTTYKVGVKAATAADIHVGDSVTVWVVRKNPDWLAQSVKITHAKK